MKKILKWVIAGLLAIALTFEGPGSIIGKCVATEASIRYISEVKIGPYDKLKSEGYEVDKESASNRYYDTSGNMQYCGQFTSDSGNGFCIGYKTTTDKSKAIYDIAVMDMYGDYTELTYAQLKAQQDTQMTKLAMDLRTVVEEFREKYNAGNAYAELALQTLNFLTIPVENNKGVEKAVPLGNFFLVTTTDFRTPVLEDYVSIVSLCTPVTLSYIENQLSLAVADDITDDSQTSWIDRLCANGPIVITGKDGKPSTDPGVLNQYYLNNYDSLYYDDAASLYTTIKTFIDSYQSALAAHPDGEVTQTIDEETVENAQEYGEAQLVDNVTDSPEYTEEQEEDATLLTDTMALALFEALDEIIYYSDDTLNEYLKERGFTNEADYIASLEQAMAKGYLSQDAYDRKVGTINHIKERQAQIDTDLAALLKKYEVPSIDELIAVADEALFYKDIDQEVYDGVMTEIEETIHPVEAAYPYGTKEDGSPDTIAQFFLRVCTTDPDTLTYANDLYRPLYALLVEGASGAPLSAGQKVMFNICGFQNAISQAINPLDMDSLLSQFTSSFKSITGKLSDKVSIWYDVNVDTVKEFNKENSGIYWTSNAHRNVTNQLRYNLLTQPDNREDTTSVLYKTEEILQWTNLLSPCISGLGVIVGVIAKIVTAVSKAKPVVDVAIAVSTGAAGAATGAATTACTVLSYIGTGFQVLAVVAMVFLLAVTLFKAIWEWTHQPVVDLEYTEVPQIIYDYREYSLLGDEEGNADMIAAALRYEPVPVTGLEGPDGKTNIFSYYQDFKNCPWVCLYYTKDPDAADYPITVEYTGSTKTTLPFVSYFNGVVIDGNTWDFDDNFYNPSIDLDDDKEIVYQWESCSSSGDDCTHTSTIDLKDYCGCSVSDIKGCEPNSGKTGGDGYAPLHAFGEIGGYNLAYYGYYQWGNADDERRLEFGNFAKEMIWYIHRPVNHTENKNNKYIAEVQLYASENQETARKHFTGGNFTLVDINLTPSSKYYTYIGYRTQVSATNAITDLRVAYASGQPTTGQELYYGTLEAGKKYASCGSVGNLTLFATTSTTAGTPLLADGPAVAGDENANKGQGFLVCEELRECDGYEPVNLFCGGPAFDFDNGGEWTITSNSGGIDKKNKEWISNWDTHRYIYFYPETTYTDTSVEYLGGLAFFSGREDGNDHQLTDYIDDMGWELLDDTDLSGHSYLMHINKTYLAFSVTHNPYRAIYDITFYEAESNADAVPYTFNVGGANYAVCEVFQQGGEGYFKYWERGMRMSHAYRCDSYWDGLLMAGKISLYKEPDIGYVDDANYNKGKAVSGYFREGYTLSNNMPALRGVTCAGLYVCGNTYADISKAKPIMIDELAYSDSPEYDSATETPIRSITDWYSEEPANLGYTEDYGSENEDIFKDTYIDYDDVFGNGDIDLPDGTDMDDHDDDDWYNLDEDLVDDGSFNLYVDEHFYLFLTSLEGTTSRANPNRPAVVDTVKIAYAGDNGYEGDKEGEEDDDIKDRAPVDEVIRELVANGRGQLIRVNLSGESDDDTNYDYSCSTIWVHWNVLHGADGNYWDYIPYWDEIGNRTEETMNRDEDGDDIHNTLYNIPVVSPKRSDEVAYVWVTYTNRANRTLSDLRLYESDSSKAPGTITIDGSTATPCGDGFRVNGQGSYYFLYEIRGNGDPISDFWVDNDIFSGTNITVSSSVGTASTYTYRFFHLKHRVDKNAKTYITGVINGFGTTEEAAKLDVLDNGGRYIYPYNLKEEEGTYLYVGYTISTSKEDALTNVLLKDNGQDSSVYKWIIGNEVYYKSGGNLNGNVYDVIVNFYGTTNTRRAKADGCTARYLVDTLFWSDPDFWKIFQGSDETVLLEVKYYLQGLSERDREYLSERIFQYNKNGEITKVKRFNAVTDSHGNIANVNLSAKNFASETALGTEVYLFACYQDNSILAPKSLVGSIFDASASLWIIGSTVSTLALAAVLIVLLKRRKKSTEAHK